MDKMLVPTFTVACSALVLRHLKQELNRLRGLEPELNRLRQLESDNKQELDRLHGLEPEFNHLCQSESDNKQELDRLRGLEPELKQLRKLDSEKDEELDRLRIIEIEFQGLRDLLLAGECGASERWNQRNLKATCIQRFWHKAASRIQAKREHFEARARASNASERCPTSKYDAILLFTSIEQFINTGKIEFLRSAESKFDALSRQQYRIVAITGLFDKGKTWIINKLFGVNLPAGKLRTTHGLSFLWIEDRRILVLDSQGVQAPVSYRGRAGATEPILEAQTTEALVFEIISRISHSVIFVVSDLTWPEQKCSQMLNQKYVIHKQKKELMVVHNMRNTSQVDEAQALFKQQVTEGYDGGSSHLSDLYFTADHGLDKPRVHHIGICNDASEAGHKFNQKNFEQIMQKIEHQDPLGSHVVLQELLQSEFNRLLPNYLNAKKESTENSFAEIQIDFSIAQSQQECFDGYKRLGTFDLQGNLTVSMKTRGVIGPLGEIIAHDVSFAPVYSVYEIRVGEDVKRCIEIECPGVLWEDVEIEEESNGVTVILTKQKIDTEHPIFEVEPIRRTHGKWEHPFRVNQEEGIYAYNDEATDLSDGVLKIFLEKRMQKRKYKPSKRQSQGTSMGKWSVPNPTSMSLPFESSPCCDATVSESGTLTSKWEKEWEKPQQQIPVPGASPKNGLSPA